MAVASTANCAGFGRRAWPGHAAARWLILASGLLWGVSATAQDATQAAAVDPPSTPSLPSAAIPLPKGDHTSPPKAEPRASTELAEVVVTATKRAQSVRKVPESITALSGEELEKIGARDMSDFLTMVPGITLQDTDQSQSGFNSSRSLSIRGISPGAQANATVGILFGDVAVSDPYGSYVDVDVDPFDLSNVEVLKGPQGTLFGATALNGAIRYEPNQPEFGRWGAKGFVEGREVQHGGHGDDYAVALNVPIGSNFALRAAGLAQYLPGTYDVVSESYNGQHVDSSHKWDARIMARWQPRSSLTVNLLYMRQHHVSDGVGLSNFTDGTLQNDSQSPSHLLTNFDIANLDIRYSFDWATLVLESSRSTRYRASEVDSSSLFSPPAPSGSLIVRSNTNASIHDYTQELRLVSPDQGPWIWLVGLYYDWYENAASIDTYLPAGQSVSSVLAPLPIIGSLTSTSNGISLVNGGLYPGDLHISERAVYGELTRKLGAGFAVTAGGRLYRTVGDSGFTVQGLLIPVYFATTTYTHFYDLQAQGFSPKFAVTWQATKNVFSYLSATRGFQFGGVNTYPSLDPRYSVPPTYNSSYIWSYEAGVRTDWFHKKVRADLTAFWLDWTNPQILQPPQGVNISDYVTNVGAAVSKGLESSLQWLHPLPGVTIGTVLTYVDAKTTKPFVAASGATIPAGTLMPQAPQFQAATTLSYHHEFGQWSAGTSLIHSYQGVAWSDISHMSHIFGYNTYTLTGEIARADLDYAPTLTLGVTNLLNHRALTNYASNSLNLAGLTPPYIATAYNKPRTIFLRLSFEM